MSIVSKEDFIGEHYVPKACFKDFEYYIEKYEDKILCNLFGANQYELFKADLTVSAPIEPQTEPYITVFNPFKIDKYNCLYISEGIKQMCIQYIYFFIQRDWINQNTNAGMMRSVSDNSSNLGYKGYNLVEAYNHAIRNYNAIQWYLCDNEELFTELNTQQMGSISGI